MMGSRAFVNNDKKALTDFLFRYLNGGGDREKIKNLVEIWVTKDGKVNICNLDITQSEYGKGEPASSVACYLSIVFLIGAVSLGVMVIHENRKGGVGMTLLLLWLVYFQAFSC